MCNVVSKHTGKAFICTSLYVSVKKKHSVQRSVYLREWLCVLARQVRFSSFPLHLPRAHCPLLSQSVSPETTYVSSSSRRAKLGDERKPGPHKFTPGYIQTHTRMDIQNSDLLESPGWMSSFLITAEPCGKWEEGDKDGWVMIKGGVRA